MNDWTMNIVKILTYIREAYLPNCFMYRSTVVLAVFLDKKTAA